MECCGFDSEVMKLPILLGHNFLCNTLGMLEEGMSHYLLPIYAVDPW